MASRAETVAAAAAVVRSQKASIAAKIPTSGHTSATDATEYGNVNMTPTELRSFKNSES